MSYKTTIAGVSFPLKGLEWIISTGVIAPLQKIRVPNPIAAKLLSSFAGQEVTIVCDETVIQRAILLGNAPCDDIWDQYLVFSDVRFYWTRKWLLMDANEQRRIGDTIVIQGSSTTALVIPTVKYLPWSLNSNVPFTWDTYARRAMSLSAPVEDRAPIVWVMDNGGLNISDKIIEAMSSDSPMPVGIARAITAIPGRTCYVDLSGIVHVSDAVPGHEEPLIDALRKMRLETQGDMTWLNNQGIRPADGYRVYFTPELEVRGTYDSAASVSPDDPYLEPVYSLPDLTTNIPATGNYPARTVGMNSWVTCNEAYRGWGPGSPSAGGGSLPALPALTDNWVADNFLTGGLYQNYVAYNPSSPDFVWARRVDRILEQFRRYYRFNPRFWARVLSARTVMAAIWDTATGLRARSAVYVNCAKRYEWKSLIAADSSMSHNDNNSYPTNGLLASGKPQDAFVVFEDEDQGIIRILPDTRSGKFAEMAPSLTTNTADLDPAKFPVAAVQQASWSTLNLVPEAQHKVAVIISMIPAAPADVRRLFYYEVSLDNAAEYLGLTTTPSGTSVQQELRTQISNARFAWGDDQNTKNAIIEGYFGANSVSAPDVIAEKALITPINLYSEIIPLATACAASSLFPKLDHYEGNLEVPMDPAIVPVGSVDTVIHRVTPAPGDKCRSTTMVHAGATEFTTPDPIQLLPSSVRRIVLQLAAMGA
jgi:hypothetical protein